MRCRNHTLKQSRPTGWCTWRSASSRVLAGSELFNSRIERTPCPGSVVTSALRSAGWRHYAMRFHLSQAVSSPRVTRASSRAVATSSVCRDRRSTISSKRTRRNQPHTSRGWRRLGSQTNRTSRLPALSVGSPLFRPSRPRAIWNNVCTIQSKCFVYSSLGARES